MCFQKEVHPNVGGIKSIKLLVDRVNKQQILHSEALIQLKKLLVCVLEIPRDHKNHDYSHFIHIKKVN